MQAGTEWRVHIGAHKTATTHLQETLAAQSIWLGECGIDYIPRVTSHRGRLADRLDSNNWRGLFHTAPDRRQWNEILAKARRGGETVVLSDENIVGKPRHLLRRRFYSRAESRLKALSTLVRSENLHLFLSIRSFDTLLPSAYVQAIRHKRIPGGIDALRRRWRRHPPSWIDLIERIRRAIPDASLQVWTFEDYPSHVREILSALSGTPRVEDLYLPAPPDTVTPSATAVRKIEAINRRLRRGAYRSEVKRILEDATDGETYSPFDADEQASLSRAYQRELDLIRTRFPGILMNFG
jgi:hypothetical protein